MMDRRTFTRSATLASIGAVTANAVTASTNQPQQLKKAVLITMLPKEMSYLDRFKLAVDVGFEGLEAQTVADPRVADEIREAADKAKLPIHSVMNMDHWQFPLSSSDPEVVARSLRGMETSLRNAKLWGADAVLLVPAVVNPQTTYTQAWERSQREIRKLIPLAEELRVVIAIEEVWNKFLLTAPDFAKYVDEFKSPWIRAYFDVGNIVMYGFPQEWIRTLGSRIVKFHLKDFKFDTRQWVPLMEGSIDWKEVRKAIGEIGFSGYLTVELPGGDAAYLKEISNRVDRILAG
ncbi:MAG: sugar phosphate isomerase/epimerase [Acidobacteria bacterium]|nr:sugar phosphate isomerase/epimerase [Acidobacteriota bacterium]MCW5969830.1 sugar phosphate isomerase/epimerase [Blastocatellales bacterium]